MKAVPATLVLLASAGLAAAQQERRLPDSWPCVDRLPVDPSYPAISEATGGQTFLFHPSEVGRSGALMIGLMDHEQILTRTLGDANGVPLDLPFPVDSTVRSILAVASVQCLGQVSLHRPGGGEVAEGGPGVEDHRFRAGRILEIKNPDPGPWVLRITGRGLVLAAVYADSTLDLDRVSFVEWRGRPGHEGYLPAGQPPAVGVPQVLEAVLSEPVESARFRMVALGGQTIGWLPLEKDADSETYRGPAVVRDPLFRVVVDGIDANGWPFQRFFTTLFQAVPGPAR